MARPRPLDAISIVFAGFIFLVLVSQLSAHVLAQAVLSYFPKGNADLVKVQNISFTLAISAAVLGFAFGGAVLLMTKKKLGTEIDVYFANGLPLGSAVRLMVSYHPVRPLGWLVAAAAFAAVADLLFGLDSTIPLYLSLAFAVLLIGWVVLLTVDRFSRRELKKEGGRVG